MLLLFVVGCRCLSFLVVVCGWLVVVVVVCLCCNVLLWGLFVVRCVGWLVCCRRSCRLLFDVVVVWCCCVVLCSVW